MPQILLK
jgi:hypothetical protein